MDDEIDLLNRARALDKEALTEIHDRYFQAIYRYFTFRINDVQAAEDLASETFIRFLSAIRDRQTPPNTIRGWLFGTAKNLLKEQYRHQRRTNWAELDESMAEDTVNPEQLTAAQMDKARLRDALAELTPDQQHILALRFGYGLAIKEVAEMVNKSEGSVKMLQVRAINTLARIMSNL